MWIYEVEKARLKFIHLRTILITPAYVKKATLFMQKTDIFKQFWGLN